MCDRTSLPDSPSVISLPASLGGPSPWPLPDGRWIDPCGLAAALASLSARQVKALGLQISGISGLHGSISSVSADLQRSLENKLRTRLTGSSLFAVTWKPWDMPWLPSQCQPALQPLSKSGSGFFWWPTPSKTDATGRGYHRSNGREYLALPGALMVSLGLPRQCPQTRRISGMFYCSLMGFPAIWHQLRPTETPSSRKPRKLSSKATAKPDSSTPAAAPDQLPAAALAVPG